MYVVTDMEPLLVYVVTDMEPLLVYVVTDSVQDFRVEVAVYAPPQPGLECSVHYVRRRGDATIVDRTVTQDSPDLLADLVRTFPYSRIVTHAKDGEVVLQEEMDERWRAMAQELDMVRRKRTTAVGGGGE